MANSRPADHSVFHQDPGHILRDATLGPGQEIDIGMPLRTRPCAPSGAERRRSFAGEECHPGGSC